MVIFDGFLSVRYGHVGRNCVKKKNWRLQLIKMSMSRPLDCQGQRFKPWTGQTFGSKFLLHADPKTSEQEPKSASCAGLKAGKKGGVAGTEVQITQP